MSFFFFFSFFFQKIGEQGGGTGPDQGKVNINERGEVVGKGSRKVNMVQNCVHMHVNAKIIPVETIARVGGGG
jgi:hypothetical protein